MTRRLLVLSSALALTCAAPALAQTRPGTPSVAVRAAGFVGVEHFSAAQTFRAVLGTANGVVYGGGVDVVFGHVFARVDVSHFGKSGERVFVNQGQVFRLGIPLDIGVTPVTASAGYRGRLARNLMGYAGGGVGSWGYSEKSDDPSEDVSFRKVGYLVLGGVEWRVQRWVALGFEGQYAAVPDALGQSSGPAGPGSASAAFNEKDLGGGSAVVRIIVGR
jgi:hypothetical protein